MRKMRMVSIRQPPPKKPIFYTKMVNLVLILVNLVILGKKKMRRK